MPQLITTTSLLDDPSDDHFDFGPAKAAAPVIPHQELGPGDDFTLRKIGGVNHIVIQADYDELYFVGTAKSDDITNKDKSKLTIVGGGGNDVINSGNNTTVQTVYGDDVQQGFTIGSTYGKYGNDILHLGAGDIGKSGNGFDKYVLHGPFWVNQKIVPAKVYMNLAKDVIDMGADPHVTAYEVAKYNSNKSAALLKSFTLTGEDAFFGPNAARFINPEIERGKALEGDAPDMWVGLGSDHKLTMSDVQHAVDLWEAKWDFIL